MGPKVSIVIPTLNEERAIGDTLRGLNSIADEILIVDGYSTDRTVDEAKKFNVKVLYDDNGKGSALRKGFSEATGGIVIMMDADGSHTHKELSEIINRIAEGYDVCMPSRFMPTGGSEDITWLRVVGNNFYKLLVRLFWGTSYTDICYGFRGFKKSALESLKLEANGFDIELEISIKTIKRKLKFIEVPSVERKRVFGKGKLTFWTSLKLDKRILLEFISSD